MSQQKNMTDLPGRRRGVARWVGLVVVAVAAILVGAGIYAANADPGPAAYVGRDSCVRCHADQHDAWVGSDHDLAMQIADEKTVLGDFSGVDFEHLGLTTHFYRDGDRFMVRTEGPDGKLHEYPVAYTFGVRPLQQYLIEFPGGRYQALTAAWDVEAKRWYSLYPDQRHAPDDWLHWTQRGQSWNSNCAECHSTNLKKGYDIATDTFNTTWSEINVSCEACHGPGSRHVHWAEASPLARSLAGYDDVSKGLERLLKDPGRQWGFDEQGNPKLVAGSGRPNDMQIDACARCHALRSPITAEDRTAEPFLDHFMPVAMREGLYHPTGQIDGEVYEFGSFLQSKMYHAGVRCTDCHNPHTTKLKLPGNALCFQCHNAARYETTQHHHHALGTPGASCVECHMPTKHYMVIDPRRDHSIRVPRPDLSITTGSPNACNQCHTDKDARWAADAVKQWYGEKRSDDPHWGPAFHAAWGGDRSGGEAMRALAMDTKRPPFIRASALWALQAYLDPSTLTTAAALIDDPAPLVRREAATLLSVAPPPQRAAALAPLLNDDARTVRYAAARALLAGAADQLDAEKRARLDAILAEHERGLTANADNKGGRASLAAFYEERADAASAQGAADVRGYEKAMRHARAAFEMDRRDIDIGMALVRLAIRMNQDAIAESTLRHLLALPKPPETPQRSWDRAMGEVEYQLGLLLAGDERRLDAGIGHLQRAAAALADSPRVHYNLGLAFSAAGRIDLAERSLLRARELEPVNPDYLVALATTHRDHGQFQKAMLYAQQLLIEFPSLPAARQILQQIQSEASGQKP